MTIPTSRRPPGDDTGDLVADVGELANLRVDLLTTSPTFEPEAVADMLDRKASLLERIARHPLAGERTAAMAGHARREATDFRATINQLRGGAA